MNSVYNIPSQVAYAQVGIVLRYICKALFHLFSQLLLNCSFWKKISTPSENLVIWMRVYVSICVVNVSDMYPLGGEKSIAKHS